MAEYTPDGDRVYYDPKYCDGEPCPVDCYRCPIAEKILEAEDDAD